jgi:hypothetical protein
LPVRAVGLAVALGVPGGAHAADMDGRYMLTREADCSDLSASEGLLRIEDGVFYGAESECRMTNGLDVRGMDAMLYDMVCTGEGLTWQERAMVMRGADGGLILVWDGYAFAYPACPGPLSRPRPRPDRLLARD